MWEFVTRELPFAGLHHGEVIHKVVTQDLRPGPWPQQPEQVRWEQVFIICPMLFVFMCCIPLLWVVSMGVLFGLSCIMMK